MRTVSLSFLLGDDVNDELCCSVPRLRTGCPADSWCSGGQETKCPQNTTTNGANEQDSAADCICKPGTQALALLLSLPFMRLPSR